MQRCARSCQQYSQRLVQRCSLRTSAAPVTDSKSSSPCSSSDGMVLEVARGRAGSRAVRCQDGG
eukprot:scaffold40397_cov60-Phaeocystis_antarctica.AAC.1